MSVQATASSSAVSPAATSTDPWATTAQSALTTLQSSSASFADKFTAWDTITNLISSHISGSLTARVTVVNDPAYTSFSDQTSKAYDEFYANAMGHGEAPGQNTQQLANNFNAMSSDDQLVISSLLGPQLGSASNFAAYLQTKANVEKVLGNAIAAAGVNTGFQLTDPKYSTLWALAQSGSNSGKITSDWTTQAEAALSALNSGSASPAVKVTLSPAAMAAMQGTNPAEANMKQGLATLSSKQAGLSSADVAVAVLKDTAAQSSASINDRSLTTKTTAASGSQSNAKTSQNQYQRSLLDAKA